MNNKIEFEAEASKDIDFHPIVYVGIIAFLSVYIIKFDFNLLFHFLVAFTVK